MTKRVIIGSLVALTLLGAGIAIGASADGQWGPGHETVIVRGDGTGAGNAGQTIVVSVTVLLASTAGDAIAQARASARRSSSSTSGYPNATGSTSRESCGTSRTFPS